MIVEELISVLSYKTENQDKAVKFQRLLDDIEKAAVKAAKALVTLTAGVGILARKFSETATKNYEWAQSLGINEETVSRFDYVAQQFGGSINDMKESMKGWSRYSIQSGKSMEEIYLREAKSIEGMSNAQSAAFLTARKYSEVEIKMIQQGEDALRGYFKSAKVLTGDQQRSLQTLGRAFRQTFSDINYAINSVLADVSEEVATSVSLIGDLLSSIITSLSPLISMLAKGLVLAITAVMLVLAPILKVVQFLWKAINFVTFGLAGLLVVVGIAISVLTVFSILIISKVLSALVAFRLSLLANETAIKGSLVVMKSWISLSKLQLFWTNALALGKKALAMIGLTENAIETALTYTKKNQLRMMILMAGSYISNTLYKKMNTLATWLNTLATNINTKGVLFNTAALRANILAWIAHAKTLISSVGPALTATWMSIKYIASSFVTGLGPVLAGAKAAMIAFGKATLTTSVQLLRMAGAAMPGLIAGLTTAWTAMASFATTMLAAVVPSLISAATASWAFTASLLANPITWIVVGIVAGIAAIGAGIYAIIKYWDDIVGAVREAWEWVFGIFDWIKNGESGLAKLLKWLTIFLFPLSAIYFYWEDIQKAIENVLDTIVNLFSSLWDLITNYYSKIFSLFDRYVLAPIRNVFGVVSNTVQKIWEPIGNFFKKIYSFITGIFSFVKNSVIDPIKNFFGGMFDWISNLFKKMFGWILNNPIVKAITNFFGEGVDEYKDRKKKREDAKYEDEPDTEYEEDFDENGDPVSEKQRKINKTKRIRRRKREAAIWKDDNVAPESAYESTDKDRKVMEDVNKQQTSIRRKEVAYGVGIFNATTENYQAARKDGRIQKAAEQAAREAYGPSVVKATPQEVNNSVSNRSVSVQNNNTINTSASSGPAIANYLKNANDLQGTGFGLSGAY